MNIISNGPTSPVIGGAATKTEHPKLRKACREMESYFVGSLMKQMHASASKGGLFGDKPEMNTYRDMFDDAVAKEIGKTGAFGIADVLYRELSIRSTEGEDL